jgi:hypothetical protein
MKNYTIPFSYTVNCTIKVEASDLDSAIAKVSDLSEVHDDGLCRLIHKFSPIITSDIDLKSIKIDEDEAEELNPKTRYEVTVRRVQTATFYVEAHSEDDACDAANGMYDDEEYDSSDFSDEEVEAMDPTVSED